MAAGRLPCPVNGHECTDSTNWTQRVINYNSNTKGTWNWEGEGVRGPQDRAGGGKMGRMDVTNTCSVNV